MKRAAGLAVGVFLPVLMITAVNAGPAGTSVIQDEKGHVLMPKQGIQNDISTSSNKARLSKRNQARIKQVEAAKKRQEMIEKSNADAKKQ